MGIVVSIISLLVSAGVAYYNIRLNRIIYGPKIRVVFERIHEHDNHGNYIEGRRPIYDVILINESIMKVYDFEGSFEFYDSSNNFIDYEIKHDIGIFREKIPCFVSGQKYRSYFADFKELKKAGIKIIRFNFTYQVKPNSKCNKETFDINVLTLSDIVVERG